MTLISVSYWAAAATGGLAIMWMARAFSRHQDATAQRNLGVLIKLQNRKPQNRTGRF